MKINADINGSLNILRKYIKKSSPNQEIAMDNGREQRPLKKGVTKSLCSCYNLTSITKSVGNKILFVIIHFLNVV